ncbi:outer membrane protein transport protein [Photobacterium aphoticum]|uniref:Aromatic hydrocarbon degradation protein n=1 Tax=Photobacterium aphoticum TaxID=754436 RepID=A0A0J1JE74_9GAMM|nr:outer membrane protein transport protein [Photobacterium aphoticum]KLU99976.1 aromatic hydrocarbon degradation protein [Photobacterium aphoticum]PSU54600.1 transporter [Photobacterium aphoticum]GHA47820.1 long-chain fatty acid transporter [Photobacterium aphoticum]
MNKKRLFTQSMVAAAITLASQQALAAGFQLNAQSATGLGRAFAGDAVIADNASVMSRNAAAMALFDKPAMSLGINAVNTDINVKNAKYPLAPKGLDDAQIGDTSYVPNIYYIHPINEKWTVGAGVYSNFGTKTEFDDNYAANEYGGLTDVKSVNFALSTAYRINEQWSIGGGLDVIYGAGKLQRFVPEGRTPLNPNKDITLLDVDADGIALGWNVGTVYELNEDNRFGLSYRYSPELEAKGDMTYIKAQSGNPNISDDKLKMPLPDMAEFSGYHRLNQLFAVHYSVQWIRWSEFDKLETTGGDVLNNYNWQDGWHYALGGTYYLNNDWTLRAGYMYDTSAQDQKTSISVPDSDRQWFSGGFTYHLDSKSNIDVGVTYLVGKDVEVKEETGLFPVTATTRANAWLYGIQYSRSF